MKKILAVCFAAMVAVLAAGCVDYSSTLQVEADGTGTYTMQYGVDQDIQNSGEPMYSEGDLDDLRRQAEENGGTFRKLPAYQIGNITYSGFEFGVPLQAGKEFDGLWQPYAAAYESNGQYYFSLDLRQAEEEYAEEMGPYLKYMNNIVHTKLTISFEGADVVETNGIRKGRDTVVWDTPKALMAAKGLWRISEPQAQVLRDNGIMPFLDGADALYPDALAFLYDRGVLEVENGYSNPEREITRAEALAMLQRYFAPETSEQTYTNTFRDVSKDDWYYPSAGWAQQCGLVKGTKDGTLEPARFLTREETVTMLYQYLKANRLFESISETDEAYYTMDVLEDQDSISPWAKDAAAFALEQGLWDALEWQWNEASGSSEIYFQPQKPVLREEFANMLYQFQAIIGA